MRRTLLVILLGFLFSLQCYSQRWLWAVGGDNFSDSWGLAIDGNTDTYITGSYLDTIRFNTTLLKDTNYQTFLVKFDPNGNVKWGASSHGINPSGWSEGIEAACDKSNNVIICGVFGDTVIIGNDTLRSSSSPYVDDIYLAKFNSNGNLIWAWQSTAPSTNYGVDLATTVVTDKFKNIYMAGTYTDTTTFGLYTFNTSTQNDAFLTKFDSNGNVQWVASSVAASFYCEAVSYGSTVDDSGNIYVTGLFVDTVSFGAYTLMTNQPFSQYYSTGEIYLVKYDKTGNVLWAWQSQGVSGYSIGYSVLTDKAQNVYMTGTIHDSVFFGPYHLKGNTSSSISADIVLAKFSPNGQLQWAHPSYSDSGDWGGYSLYKDTLNHIYFSGGGENTTRLAHVSFAGINFNIPPNSSSEPSFIMKLDTSGYSLCSSMVTGGGDDMNSVVCNPSGTNVYFSGDIEDTTIFTHDTLPAYSEFPFIARWQPCQCRLGNINIQSTSDSVCNITGAIQIIVTPQGGALSGIGVFSDFFYPDSAKIGQFNYINYYFTGSNGCFGTALDSVYVENCTGIPVIKNNIHVSIFPNPNNGEFMIRSSAVSAQSSIEIYNVLGQPVFAEIRQPADDNLININSQPSGIYFYRVIAEGGNLLGEGKFVIQK
jgi:hypothetical protein